MSKKRRRRKHCTSRNYDDPAYKEWRKAVAKRDGYKCMWPNCGSKRSLVFHHIKRWADYPNLRFEVTNGITLCRRHHDAIWGKEQEYEQMFYKILGLNNKTNRDVIYDIRAELREWQKNQDRSE